MVGDGSVQSVELNLSGTKPMPVDKAAKLIIDAAQKKKAKYHLTTSGSIGTTMHSIFPGLIDSAVRKEIKKLTDVGDKSDQKKKGGE